jgi:hypothetical protein
VWLPEDSGRPPKHVWQDYVYVYVCVCASCWFYEITESSCYNKIISDESGRGMGRKHSPFTDRDANSRYKPVLLISEPCRVQCYLSKSLSPRRAKTKTNQQQCHKANSCSEPNIKMMLHIEKPGPVTTHRISRRYCGAVIQIGSKWTVL